MDSLSTVKILLIGNGKFDDKQNIPDIPNIAANIELLEKFFSSNAFYRRFADISIEPLLDKNHYEIHRIVEKLVISLPFQSRIIIYYCGHGLYSSSTGKYFLAAKDSDVSIVDSTAIDIDKIIGPLKKSRAKEKILMVDACYSGKIHENLSDNRTLLYAQLVENAQGIFAVTSTNASRTARFDPDSPGSPTYFTKSFIETINTWSNSNREFLTINEILEEVTFQLSCKDLAGPVKTIKGDAEKFVFCVNENYDELSARKEMQVVEKVKKEHFVEKEVVFTENAKNEETRHKRGYNRKFITYLVASCGLVITIYFTVLPAFLNKKPQYIPQSQQVENKKPGDSILASHPAVVDTAKVFVANKLPASNKYVDSLKKIISLKYSWGFGKNQERTQVRYISALIALGDFYYEAEDDRTSYSIYKTITNLTIGPDSDLGENEVSVSKRSIAIKRLISMYRYNRLLLDNKPEFIKILTGELSLDKDDADYLSQSFFGTTDSVLSVFGTNGGKGIQIYFNPFRLRRLTFGGLQGKVIKDFLLKYSVFLQENPELNVLITANNKPNMPAQYTYTYNDDFVERFLVEKQGISSGRIQKRYVDYVENPKIYKGIPISFMEITTVKGK